MTAKEMFERLGYKYQESYFEGKLDAIRYIRDNGWSSNVIFDINARCFKIFRKEEKTGWCDLELLKAINKQCEELGWLDD